jgi:hypothetical protein
MWGPGDDGATPWPPQWDAPAPELHPDHPSAPVPRVRVPWMPPRRPDPGDFASPGSGPANYRGGTPYPPGHGYGPARSYSTSPGYGYPPPRDSGVSHTSLRAPSGDSGPGYAPAQGYGSGRHDGPGPRVQPHPGYPEARGYGQHQGYPPASRARGGPGRRLYAVPDSLGADTSDISPAGGQMVPFGGRATALAEPAWSDDPRDSGSLALAEQLLSNADIQAATITQDAWGQATAIREAAEQDAAAIRQQAAAIREAAEQEAADMRAAVLSMSEQLGRLAAYVTDNFAVPAGTPTALRAGAPAALVAAPPVASPPVPAGPAVKPARPATRPVVKPGKSTAQPATGTRGRQARTARKMAAVLAVAVMVGLVSGGAELALHGGRFFIFRANGAGATETGPTENQGPGQPDAPGAQHAHPAPAGKHHAPPAQNK